MNKRLLFPLFVLAVLAATQLACLDTNYYGVQPPARAQPSAAQLEAGRLAGEDLAMGVALATLLLWSFLHMGGKLHLLHRGEALVYQGVYWLLIVVGVGMFAWGVLVPPLVLAWIIGGIAQVFLAAIWGLLGNRLFGV